MSMRTGKHPKMNFRGGLKRMEGVSESVRGGEGSGLSRGGATPMDVEYACDMALVSRAWREEMMRLKQTLEFLLDVGALVMLCQKGVDVVMSASVVEQRVERGIGAVPGPATCTSGMWDRQGEM